MIFHDYFHLSLISLPSLVYLSLCLFLYLCQFICFCLHVSLMFFSSVRSYCFLHGVIRLHLIRAWSAFYCIFYIFLDPGFGICFSSPHPETRRSRTCKKSHPLDCRGEKKSTVKCFNLDESISRRKKMCGWCN